MVTKHSLPNPQSTRIAPPPQPVPTEWVARDRERKIPLGELWQEITGRAEGSRPLPPARLGIARDD
jgi:hypothetical protein